MDNVAIGTRIREARLKIGMTQEALAQKLDIGSTYVSDIERGIKSPSFSLFINLIKILGVSADYILRGEVDAGKSYVYNELNEKLDNLTPQQRENVLVMINAYIKTLD